MSFNRYRKKSVQERLSESQYHPNSNRFGNLVRAMTIGLMETYKAVDSKSNWRQSSDFSSDSEGFLDLISRPIQSVVLNRRYVHEKLIATGTFAQIHLFGDKYSGKQVAVKITKSGCNLLSLREKAFLDHILHAEKRGVSYFARVKDIFVHEGRLCLTMPFYQGTLMGFVFESYKPQQLNAAAAGVMVSSSNLSTPSRPWALSSSSANGTPLEGVNTTILQPRPIRSSVTPSVSKSSSAVPKGTPSKTNITLREFTAGDMCMLKRIAMQLLSALWLLQKEEIIHGDLKPENCFLEYQTPVSSASSSSSAPMHQDSPSYTQLHHNYQNHQSSKSTCPSLATLPMTARVKLGDFGNSLHISEIPQYLEDYEVQSFPYRAPEVLLGLRFNSAIDVWSLGIIIIELVIGQTLFHPNSREEAIRDIETHICKLSKTRFSSGKFASCLFHAARWQSGSPGFTSSLSTESSQWNRLEQTKSLKRLLLKHVSFQQINSYEVSTLVDFLTGLTAVDPTHRITPFDALQHPFLVEESNLPMGVIIQTVHDAEENNNTSTGSYNSSASSRTFKRRRMAMGPPPFHSLKNF